MGQIRVDTLQEITRVLDPALEPELRAVLVAIHLEDALGTTIPADLLTAEHLASAEAAHETLRLISEHA